MNKSIIVGKNISELSAICIENKFPKFHGEQLYKWLYQKSVNDITKMSNIPDSLKIIINKKYKLNPLKIKKN